MGLILAQQLLQPAPCTYKLLIAYQLYCSYCLPPLSRYCTYLYCGQTQLWSHRLISCQRGRISNQVSAPRWQGRARGMCPEQVSMSLQICIDIFKHSPGLSPRGGYLWNFKCQKTEKTDTTTKLGITTDLGLYCNSMSESIPDPTYWCSHQNGQNWLSARSSCQSRLLSPRLSRQPPPHVITGAAVGPCHDYLQHQEWTHKDPLIFLGHLQAFQSQIVY